jgi:outer membrane receptor protein involved in Fe transport
MNRHLFVSSSIFSLSLFCSAPALAQAASSSVETLVVTGSHIAAPGYASPTPVTSISTDTLLSANASTVADALRQLPILAATFGARGSSSTGNNGQTALNLRNLGTGNTLVLLNGNRVAPNTVGAGGLLYATVDIGMLPLMLLQRADVVTGGAGAVYGSDAVAGVVNFILDKKYEGFKGDVLGGIDDAGGEGEAGLKFAAGTSFGGGHGHFEASAELYQNKGIYSLVSTKLGKRSCAVISLPAGGPTTQSFQCGVTSTNGNFQGLITAGPLKGTTFDNAGNPATFHYGTLVTGSTQVGGDGIITNSVNGAGGQKTATFFQRASWDFGDGLDIWIEASHGNSRYDYQAGTYDNSVGGTALTIRNDNAYLPAALKTAMAANKITTFSLGKYFADLPRVQILNHAGSDRIVVGADGKIFGDWSWDTHFENGQTEETITALYDMDIVHVANAADAVVNPATGTIVCRSTLTDPTNGCLPFNVFGNAGMTPDPQGRGINGATDAQLNYLTSTDSERMRVSETDAAANLSGDLFDGWAGAVSSATGLEWRYESMAQVADPYGMTIIPSTGAPPYLRGNFTSQFGHYSVLEGYLETDAPLLRNVPFAAKLDFNGAVRLTNYSNYGNALTYKAGLVWDVTEEFRLRGTASRDVRAASLAELYSGAAPGRTSVTDFGLPGNPTNPAVIANSSGNPNLKPQHGVTMTLGLVYTPEWLPGFQASMDGYRISIVDAIANYTTAQIVQFCAQGNAAQCAFIIRNPDGTLFQVNQKPQNIGKINTEGVDFEGNYDFDLDDWMGLEGEVGLHGVANYVSQFISILPGSVIFNAAGLNVTPQWRWTFQTRYSKGPFAMFVQARWSGAGLSNKDLPLTQIDRYHIGGQTLVDLNFQYAISVKGGTVSPYFNVTDLFNDIPSGAAFSTRTNGYDLYGRHYRAGIRFSF